MSETLLTQFHAAVRDFRQARRRADLQQIMARFAGRPTELLSYEDVVAQLKATGRIERGVQEIALESIVGSVGRADDFTRTFLPRKDSDEERWTRVRAAMLAGAPMDPIDVFQIGDVYFVVDGNHRVSVSREMGARTIRAHVTEIKTDVPVSVDDNLDEICARARQSEFMVWSGLGETLDDPDAIRLTTPGMYRFLREQIQVQQFLLQEASGQPVTLEEAAHHWYDAVYRPVIEIIRYRGVLRDFPDRTEADLYVWLAEHQAELRQDLGWDVAPEQAVLDLAARRRPRGVLARVGQRVRQVVARETLMADPEPGQWRKERLAWRRQQQLFVDILVVLSHVDASLDVLEQALLVAGREQSPARLHGLFLFRDVAQQNAADLAEMERRFMARCAQAGIEGHISFTAGDGLALIDERARWVDLVVAELTHPPGPQARDKLASRFYTLLQRCPRPVLVVPPQTAARLERPLLAYDGSPKAAEALFTAAYLADRWRLPLTVTAVAATRSGARARLNEADAYLNRRGVSARLVPQTGEVVDGILAAADKHACDFILMGGFGFRPVLEIMLGSAVQGVLQRAERPVFVCR